MDMSRIRRGEMIAAVGGIVLLIVLLFVNWYSAGAQVSTPLGSVNVEGDFGAALVAYGGWESMKEEGTTFDQARDQLQSRYGGGPGGGTPPPPADAAPPDVPPPGESQPPPGP